MIKNSLKPISETLEERKSNDPGAHYRKEYKGVKLDPFRIAHVYGITNFALFTALKKILCIGNRGYKDLYQDLADIRNALDRFEEMLEEDGYRSN